MDMVSAAGGFAATALLGLMVHAWGIMGLMLFVAAAVLAVYKIGGAR